VYLYALLAFLDMEANYLAVFAYQYTDITSILLLNSLTIPWVVILSYVILGRRYNLKQMIAVLVCIGGLGLVIGSDILRDRWGGLVRRDQAWIGDLVCVGSSFLYAVQNVLQEYILKKLRKVEMGGKAEYFGMLGAFGLLFSLIQWSFVERRPILEAGSSLWTGEVIGLFFGFIGTMISLYLMITWFIEKYDASLFNMSILTSGVYGLLLEFMQKKTSPRASSDWMYFVAYAMIVFGVILYSINDVAGDTERTSSNTKLSEPLSPSKSAN
jgi:solute carrier family 35 protein F1/2